MFRYAFRFISYDKIKSIGVIIGIVISTFLVGQQAGIFIFLTGTMSALVDNTQADLWIVDNRTSNANALGQIDVRIGRQVESLDGVQKAFPIVIAAGTAKFPGGRTAPVTIIGAQPPAFRGGPWNVTAGSVSDLIEEGSVSADVFDKRNLSGAGLGTSFEINGRRVHVAVETRGVRAFGGTYVFTAIERARWLGRLSKNKVSAFLVDVRPDANPSAVRDRINASIFGARAWTRTDFSASTVDEILSTSGIAFSIGTLIIFAVIAGMIIIGLTMYSAAVDRLRDYGTLKAIGADNRIVRRLILIQAVFFALVAYGISVTLIEGFRRGIANSGIIFNYSGVFKLTFFAVTIFIALVGALFAVRRLGKVEPASVFRQ